MNRLASVFSSSSSSRKTGGSGSELTAPTTTAMAPWRRNDAYYSAMIFLLSVGLTFLMYSFYRYLVEEKKRWKQVSGEFSRQRALVENLTTEMQKIQVDSKNMDDKWRDQIRSAIEHSPPTPVVAIEAPPPPDIPQPVILSANDMDRELEEELSELQEMVTSSVRTVASSPVPVLVEEVLVSKKQVDEVEELGLGQVEIET